MTLTVLVSVSLLALVSTARPIRDFDDDAQVHLSAPQPADVHTIVQAVLDSHTGTVAEIPDCAECESEDVRVRFTSAEEQHAFLAQLDDSAVKALVRLGADGVRAADEAELCAILGRWERESGRRTPVPDEVVDALCGSPNLSADVPLEPVTDLSEDTGVEDTSISPVGFPEKVASSRPVLVLVAACAVALLVVSCVAAALFLTEVLRSRIFTSRAAYELLPTLEKHVRGEGGDSSLAVSGRKSAGLIEQEKWTEKGALQTLSTSPPESVVRGESEVEITIEKPPVDTESCYASDDEQDEKFHDAEPEPGSVYATPLIDILPLPSTDSDASSPKPPTGTTLLPPPAPSAQVAMRDVAHLDHPNAVQRARASGADPDPHALAPILTRRGGADRDERRRRAFAAVPELDAALAMQLRPGLGLGAAVDAAWLVRFVMAFFGWCAVLVSGPRA